MIFEDEVDCELFLETLGEACSKTGWLVHAYVLMGNHYHLMVETPEANLVAGMKWLQGTYTQRFNSRHKLCGHLLQGRYKALNVYGIADYFLTVSNYIHLNPARAKMIPGRAGDELAAYSWSSFPSYLLIRERPAWLAVERTLGSLGLSDCSSGLIEFKAYMDKRVLEILTSAEPMEFDEQWAKIRRGWCYGDEDFRSELLERLDDVIGKQGRRDSFCGAQARGHDELEADRLVRWGMERLQLAEEDFKMRRKNDPAKQVICWLLRSRTVVTNRWIAERLHCGHPSNVSAFVGRVSSAKEDKLNEMRELLKIKD